MNLQISLLNSNSLLRADSAGSALSKRLVNSVLCKTPLCKTLFCKTLFCKILLCAIALMVSPMLWGDDEPVFDRYSLQASAEGEVNNDLLLAELVVESENRDAATLANHINATMAWALEQAKRYPTVKTQSGNYNTWPQYERKQNRIIGWRSSQILKLESDDFSTARKLIKVLQERLQVRGMQLAAKTETRRDREDDLISEALNAFTQRASLVQATMGASSYQVIKVNIITDARMAAPPRMARNYASESMKVASEPAIAAGSTTLTVSIDGQIQLQ